MSRRLEFIIDSQYDGKKLYTFLKSRLKMSTRVITSVKHIENGYLLNGEHIRTVDLLSAGDKLVINMPEEKTNIPESDFSGLNIVYEDDDVVVINKPAHLAVHPTHNHQGDTLANQVSAYYAAKGEPVVFRAVGRLDKCTSGLVVCALNRHSASVLSGNIDKTYFAIAGGVFHGKGTIDVPIIRPDAMKTLRAVGEGGEHAVTHWESIACDGELSLLRITLETGRTHQIRVHFASLGAPLAGDEMYGSPYIFPDRAALHCSDVNFIHPVTNAEMHFCVPMPDDMMTLTESIISSEYD